MDEKIYNKDVKDVSIACFKCGAKGADAKLQPVDGESLCKHCIKYCAAIGMAVVKKEHDIMVRGVGR